MSEEIKLSGIEQASYWWTNRLMYMTRYFASICELGGCRITSDELKFLSIFSNYTDKEWRDLYLELTKCITEDVNNFVPTSQYIGIEKFSQDTTKGSHDRLNAELAKITGVQAFPDIRLADSGHKDEVIYTNKFGSSVWYKSCGKRPLEDSYEPTYILTGNEKELNLYNDLIATLAVLDAHHLHDMDLFRQSFCKAYSRQNAPIKDIGKIRDLFNKCFHEASERGIVLGRFWQKTFSTSLLKYDLKGLSKDCIDNGKRYSSSYISHLEYLEQEKVEDNNSSTPTSADEDIIKQEQ